MKTTWNKPTITRIACPALTICAAVIFHLNTGTIRMQNLTITPGKGSLTVGPTAVTIKP